MSKTLFGTLILISHFAMAQHPEEVRLRGFAQHQKGIDRFDRSRDKGEIAYLEELEKWERQRLAALEEHKKQKKIESPQEGGKEWRADLAEKQAYEQELEQSRQDYIKKQDRFNRQNAANLPSEEEELGLTGEQRPRYDIKKRASFGAPLGFGLKSAGSTSKGGSFGGGSGSFPAPPAFNDFGDDSGFVPGSNLGEYDSGSDFPPPPPPPPPPFSDGGDFPEFPPPPPPPDFNDGPMPGEF
ncbi:MAG: hypothetical protein ACLGGX_03875 [Bdellovibrionia bacterium]